MSEDVSKKIDYSGDFSDLAEAMLAWQNSIKMTNNVYLQEEYNE